MKHFFSILKKLLPPCIGVALIYVAFNQFDATQINEIINKFKSANYIYIFISLLLALVGYFSRAYRWLLSLKQLGYSVKFINSFVAVNISYLLNLTIPRSGEVSRAGLLTKTDNIPFQEGFGTIVAERIIDFIILLFITGVVVILKFDTIVPLVDWSKFSFSSIKFFILIGIIFIILIIVFLKIYGKKIITLLKSKTSGFSTGIQAIVNLQKKQQFLFHTLLIWTSYILMFYVTIYSFNETATLTFDQVLTGFVVGSFAIVFTNGGIGAYPLLIAKVFVLYNIPETIGTAFGWIVWTSQIILILILGFSSFLILPFLKSNNK